MTKHEKNSTARTTSPVETPANSSETNPSHDPTTYSSYLMFILHRFDALDSSTRDELTEILNTIVNATSASKPTKAKARTSVSGEKKVRT